MLVETELDTKPESTLILCVLLKGRIVRIGVTICAVVAVVALSMLPATHLHRSISGKSLVHSHFTADPVEHAGALDHADHNGVRTFVSVFTAERTTDPVMAPTVVTAVFLLAAVEPRPLAYNDALEAPVIQGPPLRVISLRAPPA